MQVSWSPIASWMSSAATAEIDAAGQPADHQPVARPARGCGRFRSRGTAPWSSRRRNRRCGGRNWRAAPRLPACAPPRDGTARRRGGANRRRSPRTAPRSRCRRRGSPAAAASRGRHGSSTPAPSRRSLNTPSNSGVSSMICNSARPNSRLWPPSTWPPSAATIACSP